MSEEQLYDINEVCRLLDTTSRTLRFYEEKGLIQSTKNAFSPRRQYTAHQVERIRHVIVLRTLGLSVNAILDLQQNGTNLKDAIVCRRAEMLAIIEEKNREIRILNEALCLIDEGKDIFEQAPDQTVNMISEDLEAIASACTKAVIENDEALLYSFFSPKLSEYMPIEVYRICRHDTLAPLGSFVSYDRIERDAQYPNVVYQYVKHEKLGLKMKYVFRHRQIQGFWMGYYQQ